MIDASGSPRDPSESADRFRDLARDAGLATTLVGSEGPVRVVPTSPEGVGLAVRLAGKVGLRCAVARGDGETSSEAGLWLDLSSLDRIADILPGDMLAVVQAGVTMGELRRETAARGLIFPPARLLDPTETVGSLLACGGGSRGLADGPARDYVLGLRAATAAGDLVGFGSRAIKNATGYSLSQLLTGSRNALGVIVEATLRLAPRLPAVRTIVAEYASVDAASRAALLATPANGRASVVDLLDSRASAELVPLDVAEGRSALLCLVEATAEPLAVEAADRLVAELASKSARAVRILDATEAEAVWGSRQLLAARLRGRGGLQADLTATRESVVELLRTLAADESLVSAGAVRFGSVGSGGLTVIAPDVAGPEERRRVAESIIAIALAHDAALTDLQGSGLGLWAVADSIFPPATAQLVRAAKVAFDPDGVLVPSDM
jgi:FAD/FMN-containing dehydrogenase